MYRSEPRSFSALQRAENSSIRSRVSGAYPPADRFSALQRAENSSILIPSAAWISSRFVSVLFSEPKIPQCRMRRARRRGRDVSVLFSEPKIPQSTDGPGRGLRMTTSFSALQRAENSSIGLAPLPLLTRDGFSALQRAENSSIEPPPDGRPARHMFQCSSASRKFLNRPDDHNVGVLIVFQCSSASRKFLNP